METTITKFNGSTFCPPEGVYTPPKLGKGHRSAREGTELTLIEQSGRVYRARVSHTIPGQRTDQVYLVCDVFEAGKDDLVKVGSKIIIRDANSWTLCSEACNIDPLGFSGTITDDTPGRSWGRSNSAIPSKTRGMVIGCICFGVLEVLTTLIAGLAGGLGWLFRFGRKR